MKEKKRKPKIVRMNINSKIVELLKRAGKPFVQEITNTTIKLIVPETEEKTKTIYLLSEKDLGFKSLAFIKNVKSEGARFDPFNKNFAIDSGCFYKYKFEPTLNKWPRLSYGLPLVKARDVNYFRWNNISLGVHYDIIEIDINNAYWNTALKMGVISEKTYEKGLNEMTKIDRLVSLGSLATIVNVYQYNPDKKAFEIREPRVNEFTRNIFFNIAKNVGDIINSIFEKAGKNNIVFYWVDALFCRTYSTSFVENEFEKLGIEFKKKVIQSCNVYQKGKEKKVCLLEIKQRHETHTDFSLRTFSIPPPREKIKEYMEAAFRETLESLSDNDKEIFLNKI